MIKKHIFTLVLLAGFVSCRADGKPAEAFEYPLSSFAVKVGDSWYYASLDHNTRTASVGVIAYPDEITDVCYVIPSGASISPEPAAMSGNWAKEQEFVITDAGGASVVYSVVFTAWKEKPEFRLVFSDEFDVDGNPNPGKWVLCPKGTSDWNDEMSESYEQAYVRDGRLFLTAEKDGDEYKAGGIKTQDRFSFTFGKVECRARISRSPDGAFPAIWMMPQKSLYQDWPACGEIDIMEHIRQEPHIHQTIHTHYRNTLGYETNTTAQTTCDYTDYVVYGLEWTSEYLSFLVDGVETFRYENMHLPDEAEMKQWPYGEDSAFYLILNMGLGDSDTWAGPVDDSRLPAVMEVDWIRVYEPMDTIY